MEIWKKYPDSDKYLVSSLGRVKSLHFGKERILKHFRNNRNYLLVDLRYDGERHRWLVSRLVAYTFKGKSDLQAAHLNHNKKDNSLANIQYQTQSENIKADFKCGNRSHKGSKHPQAKLNERQVLMIREMYRTADLLENGYTSFETKDFLKFIGISKRTLQAVLRRETWTHI